MENIKSRNYASHERRQVAPFGSVRAAWLVGSLCWIPFAACGSSDSQAADRGRTPWDVGGTVTLLEETRFGGDPVAILEVPFGPFAGRRELAVGGSPWRHRDGTLYYVASCGENVSHVGRRSPSGDRSIATPCSDRVSNAGRLPTYFSGVAVSPNRRRVAVEARWYSGEGVLNGYEYDVVVFEGQRVAHRYAGYHAPAFIDGDRLVLASLDGLFVARVGQDPKPVNPRITGFTNNPDPAPGGTALAFEWQGNLWLVDTGGSGLREIATGDRYLRYPEWSPDGAFIAFLATVPLGTLDLIAGGDPSFTNHRANTNYEKRIHYVAVETGERWQGDIAPYLGKLNTPEGQLSWLP